MTKARKSSKHPSTVAAERPKLTHEESVLRAKAFFERKNVFVAAIQKPRIEIALPDPPRPTSTY